MTKKIWEKRLLSNLRPLQKAERKKILEYYREMYGDKVEAGFSEAEILAEFGSPEACAARILAEENVEIKPIKETGKTPSPLAIVGICFVSLILVLPLAITAFALIVTFFAVSVSGAAIAIAGVIYAIGAPLLSIGSLPAAGCFAHLGVGLTLCGVGCLLFVAFAPLTKYLAIGTGKTLAFLYKGRFF